MPADHEIGDRATVDDGTLLRRTAAGDREAFERLVRRHHAAVMRLLRATLPPGVDAEDAAQDVFLSAYRGSGTYRGEASVTTWLLTIARHAAHHARERAAHVTVDTLTPDELAAVAGWGDRTPECILLQAERRQVLTRALGRLDPEDREVLVLRDLEGLSGEETARAIGATVAAMKSRLHRARLRLAAAARRGGLDAAG